MRTRKCVLGASESVAIETHPVDEERKWGQQLPATSTGTCDLAGRLWLQDISENMALTSRKSSEGRHLSFAPTRSPAGSWHCLQPSWTMSHILELSLHMTVQPSRAAWVKDVSKQWPTQFLMRGKRNYSILETLGGPLSVGLNHSQQSNQLL